MSNKPDILDVRFAVDGSDSDSPLIGIGPPSGLRDDGYALNDVPSSSDFDFLYNRYYRWLQYLSDGQFSGACSFDSDVDLTTKSLTVTPFTFTADNTTEIFTKTTHGLLTGDGPFRVSNSGGALPTGLVAATDYWVIKLTANTFKLATSRANSFTGANLLISTNGTGTQTMSSTVSTVRPALLEIEGSITTGGDVTVGSDVVVSGAAVVSGTVSVGLGLTVGSSLTSLGGNLTVAGITTATGGLTAQSITTTGTDTIKHPAREICLTASSFVPRTGGSSVYTINTVGGKTFNNWRFGTGGNGVLVAGLDLRTGDRVLTIAFICMCVGGSAGSGGDFALNAESTAGFALCGGPQATPLIPTNTVVFGGNFTLTGINYTITSGQAMSIAITNTDTAGTAAICQCSVTYDRP